MQMMKHANEWIHCGYEIQKSKADMNNKDTGGLTKGPMLSKNMTN